MGKTGSLVIPVFNEEMNVERLISECEILNSFPQIELILVENGSTDATRSLLQANLSRISNAKIVLVEKNRGYGFGILQGLGEARGEILGWTHADLQTPIEDVLRGFALLGDRPEIDLVKGARRDRPLKDRILTWGFQVVARLALGFPLHEINAQPKVFRRAFFERMRLRNPPDDFSLDLFVLCLAHQSGAVLEIPVEFRRRGGGEAKGGGGGLTQKWKVIRRSLKQISDLRKKRIKS